MAAPARLLLLLSLAAQSLALASVAVRNVSSSGFLVQLVDGNETDVEPRRMTLQLSRYMGQGRLEPVMPIPVTFTGLSYPMSGLSASSFYLLTARVEGSTDGAVQMAPVTTKRLVRTLSASEERLPLVTIESVLLRRDAVRLSLSANVPQDSGLEMIARPSVKACSNVAFGEPVAGRPLNGTTEFSLRIQSLPLGTVGLTCADVCVATFAYVKDPQSGRKELFLGDKECSDFEEKVAETAARRQSEILGFSDATEMVSASTMPGADATTEPFTTEADTTQPPSTMPSTTETTTRADTTATAQSTTTTTQPSVAAAGIGVGQRPQAEQDSAGEDGGNRASAIDATATLFLLTLCLI